MSGRNNSEGWNFPGFISGRDNSEGWNILGYIKKGYQGEEEGIFQDI